MNGHVIEVYSVKVVEVRMPFARLSVFTRAQENRRSTVHEW